MIEAFSTEIAAIILLATLLAFLAKKSGQPTIVAYIVSGLILSWAGIVSGGEYITLFSELGLMFLLFLIGLEMEIERLGDIFKPLLLISVIQMAGVAASGAVISYLLGFNFYQSIFIGAAFMFSSTALVVKLLSDKEEISSLFGKIDIGVLLVQDVAVVILFSLVSTGLSSPQHVLFRFLEVLALIGLISVAAILMSRYGFQGVLRRVSDDPHVLFIFALAWAFLFISIAEIFHISVEIGAFVAGLALAQLPYSFEIQERVRPLTDLFMAIFFINFGLGIQISQISSLLGKALIAAGGLMVAKFIIFSIVIQWQEFDLETSFLGSISMTQTSEFSLILAALALSKGLIGQEVVSFISLVAIITMGSSSYLIKYSKELYSKFRPIYSRYSLSEGGRPMINRTGHTVVVGYDELAINAVEEIKKSFEEVVVVDRNPENVKELSETDVEYVYGDIRHGKIREKVSLDSAEFLISFVPNLDVNKQILRMVERDTTVFSKARSFEEASELYDLDAHYVIIKNMLSGERLGEQLKAYFEDRDVFLEEIDEEKRKINWRSRTWE